MEYTVCLAIEASKEKVAQLFIDRECMARWQPGLVAIEDEVGHLFDAESIGYLIFQFEQQMRMKVSVIENILPDSITIVYEVPGAYNRCINRFCSQEGYVKWQMAVVFEFEEPVDIPMDKFIKKTRTGMETFKRFVEAKGLSKSME